jgi:peptidoglycan/LPS O-acetylase OafA/YrhL
VLAPLLQCRPARYLGAVSYGLYLLHMLALNVVRRALPGLAPLLLLAATLALTLVLAALSQRFLEQPALRLKRLFTPGAAPQPGALPLG